MKKKIEMGEAIYSVGEVSKLLGIPKQTIRYYDNEGVVVPKKNPITGERSYSTYDAYKITIRKQYRNLGLSVNETEKIFNEYDKEKIIDTLDDCEKKLREEKRKLEIYIEGVNNLKEKIKRVNAYLNKCYLMKRPSMYRHIHMIDNEFTRDENSIKSRIMAMETMPLSTYSFKLEFNEEREEYLDLKWDLAIESKYGDLTTFKNLNSTYFVEEEDCIYTIFEVKEKFNVTIDSLNYAKRYIEMNDMKMYGTIYGNSIFSDKDKIEGQRRYFEAWIPVKNK